MPLTDHEFIRIYSIHALAGISLAVTVLLAGCGDSRVPQITSLAEESTAASITAIEMPAANSTVFPQSQQVTGELEWAFLPTYEWEDVNTMRELSEEDIDSEYGFSWSWREKGETFDYTAADYNSLVFFRENTQWGVAKQTGEIVIPSSYNARLCDCNLTNEAHDTYFAPDGTVFDNLGGHGGPPQFYYDENNKYLVSLDFGGIYPVDMKEMGLNEVMLVPVCQIPESYGAEGLERTDFTLSAGELQYAIIRNNGTAVTLVSQEKFQSFAESITRAGWDWHGVIGNDMAELTVPTAVQMLDGNWKFLDSNGQDLPIGVFEDAWSFSKDGIAAVKRDGMWGYIDFEGNILVPFVLDDASRTYAGKAWVKKDGLWGVLDVKGDSNESANT